MGEHNVQQYVDEQKSQTFMKALLEDLSALTWMLENDCIESGVTRIGAEQEMFLLDRHLRPAPVSLEVLKHANDARLTTEIARFNLEANLTPLRLENSPAVGLSEHRPSVRQPGVSFIWESRSVQSRNSPRRRRRPSPSRPRDLAPHPRASA